MLVIGVIGDTGEILSDRRVSVCQFMQCFERYEAGKGAAGFPGGSPGVREPARDRLIPRSRCTPWKQEKNE